MQRNNKNNFTQNKWRKHTKKAKSHNEQRLKQPNNETEHHFPKNNISVIQKHYADNSIAIKIVRRKTKMQRLTARLLFLIVMSLLSMYKNHKELKVVLVYLTFVLICLLFLTRGKESREVRVVPNFGIDCGSGTFYDIDTIECVIINETVTTRDAFYYLAMILRDESVVPLFADFVGSTPLKALTLIHQSIRTKLGK
jgi:hypothetical protein